MKLDIGLIIDDVWYVFYTYSIKSSITSHLTDRLAIAILSWRLVVLLFCTLY